MLPMNIYQKFRERLNLLCRGSLPADFKQIPAGLYFALYDDDTILLHRDFKRLDLLPHRIIRHLKDQLHQRVVRPSPYQIFVRTRPQRKVNGADNNGFAGSSLPA